MPLKPEQIARLAQIVRDASTAVAITTVGAQVPKEERDRLVREGYITLPIAGDLVFDSFAFGQVMQQQAMAQGLSYDEFQEWLKKHPVALSAQERYAVEVAQRRAGTYCVGLGNRYSEALGTILIDADQELATKTRGHIQDAVATKLAERQTVKQLKSALGNLTGDWKRDWDRIAITESHQAHQEGYLHSVTEEYGDEEMLAKMPEPGACPECLKHYLEDGRPIVRPASWWHAQGPNNAGRKQKEWKPVLGAMHPHCRCQLTRVPKGWGFDEKWDLVPMEKSLAKSQQLFLGPRGGKWADAKHTVSWAPDEAHAPARIAATMRQAESDTTAVNQRWGKLADQLPDGTEVHSGQNTFTKIRAGGDTFWQHRTKRGNSRGHFSSAKMYVEAGGKALAEVLASHGLHGADSGPIRSGKLTVLQERAKNPAEWNLPAGARVSDPWKPKPVDPETKWEHPDYGEGKGAAPWQQGTDWHPAFHKYDYMLVNSSGGKDSQAMLSHVVAQAKSAGYPLSKLVVVHADLGRVEWEGTRDLAKQQAEHYGLRFEVVQRQQNDLLEQIEERHGDLIQRETDVAKLREAGVGTWQALADTAPARILAVIGEAKGSSKWAGGHRAKELQRKAQAVVAAPGKRKPEDTVDFGKAIAWPSADARYCTSDHKRGEVKKLMTKLTAEAGKPVKILNALGIRAQESASRAAMPNFSREETTGKRTVDRWYPIHLWPEERVWNEIKGSGVPTHKAYSLGMRRLSCAFCVFASKEDLMLSAIHNPTLFQTYVDLEQKVGSSFQPQRKLADIRAEIQAKQDAGYSLNELAQWVQKAYGFDFDLAKALVSPQPTLAVAVLEAALVRLGKHAVKPTTMTMEWKAKGACVHLDTETASHHVLYLSYPAAYNASLVVAAIAQKHGLAFEEHNPPGPLEGAEGDEMAKAQQLFLGPRGGKWADPQHTISWQADIMQAPKVAKPEPEPAPSAEPEPRFPSHANPIRQRLALRTMLDDSWRAADGIDDGAAKEYGTTLAKLAAPATQERLQKEIAALSQYKAFNNPRILDSDFKAWFGDWESGEGSSKVIKADGSPAEQYGTVPVKVFHGTPVGGFKSFAKDKDKGANIFGKGFYFTEDEGIAVEYTRKDEDEALASATGFTDSDGNEIPYLTKSQAREFWDLAKKRDNPNWTPNHIWAVLAATTLDGRVDVKKLISEYWHPSGTHAEHAERLKQAAAWLHWGPMAEFPHTGLLGAAGRSHYGSHGGGEMVVNIMKVLGASLKGIRVAEDSPVKPVLAKPQVFEVYLNIRNPLSMEARVPPRELRQLSEFLKKRAVAQEVKVVESARAAWAKVTARGKLQYQPESEYLVEIEREKNKIVWAESRLDRTRKWKTGRVYADDVISMRQRAVPGIDYDDRDQTIGISYASLLKIKQMVVDGAHKTRGILHLTPRDTLTWGDVHYLITNLQNDTGPKEAFRTWAQSAGYDGISHMGGWNIGTKEHRVWIAWEPNQIKDTTSAGFNPATDDIYKSHKLDGRLKFQGFNISVEQDIGSVRHWKNHHDGTSGSTVMKLPYGYIRGTKGADGDHVDVFVGSDEAAKNVYVVHTRKAPDFKRYDECKAMLGLGSAKAAKAAFLEHYNRPEFFGSMTTLPLEEFREKVYAANGEMVKAWEAAVASVGIPADRFHLVVKYARQGHPEARGALDAVYAQMEKAAGYEGYGGGRDSSIVGTMGWWGRPARTAGETARGGTHAEPQADWPPGRKDMKRKRPKRDQKKLAGHIAKVASVEGLRPPGAHHVHRFDLVSDTTARTLDSDPDNKANLLRTAHGSRELREASKLDHAAVKYPPGKSA